MCASLRSSHAAEFTRICTLFYADVFLYQRPICVIIRVLSAVCAERSEAHIRLACLIHAASVHPEPGSNSQKMSETNLTI